MQSSILRIVMAASVANFRLFTLDIAGSMTPCARLFLTLPFVKSRPEYLRAFFFSSLASHFWAAFWKTLSLARSSVASFAAFMAKTLGMMQRASENSAMANYSLDPRVLAKSSRYTLSATSTEPPPATMEFDSRTLLITHRESWRDLSISSRKKSFAPLTIIV